MQFSCDITTYWLHYDDGIYLPLASQLPTTQGNSDESEEKQQASEHKLHFEKKIYQSLLIYVRLRFYVYDVDIYVLMKLRKSNWFSG